MTLRNIIKINSTIVVFLIISLLSNNSAVLANVDQDAPEIDISSGYTSEVQTLKWMEVLTFEFEVIEPTEFTFEITDIFGAIDYYSFNHEGKDEASAINSLDVGEIGVGETLNHDNLPVGSHVDSDVLRDLKISEANNYTLTFSNEHEHEADDLQFKFKFTVGLSGDEQFGTVGAATADDTPGFGLFFSIAAILAVVFITHKFQRSKQVF